MAAEELAAPQKASESQETRSAVSFDSAGAGEVWVRPFQMHSLFVHIKKIVYRESL